MLADEVYVSSLAQVSSRVIRLPKRGSEYMPFITVYTSCWITKYYFTSGFGLCLLTSVRATEILLTPPSLAFDFIPTSTSFKKNVAAFFVGLIRTVRFVVPLFIIERCAPSSGVA
ncbi:hypothetical protein OUZ56_007160 [Daphnia magna]|uniref:Uncharacterized protein n=1 Tax=Daphnia magna TaxID=35525 RepID=A0ABQ9YY99_9CRUS|nr:hypothetical protein OUZ56_007160 [Daphnia magna]